MEREAIRISKEQSGGGTVAVTAQELEQINKLSQREMREDEVFVFSVKLCDNEVDRDGECFPRETLCELAPMFLGKGGLFDHSWSAKGQSARLFATEVVDEPVAMSQSGEGYAYLKGLAYMIRTQDNAGLIAEIEGGIKKEVSVGCSVGQSACSICGGDPQGCPHDKGEVYDGKLCYTRLLDAKDAYEFSFVAVPAQPRAGVMRRKGHRSLKNMCKEYPEYSPELARLEKEAKLGRRYLSDLREDVIRLGLLAQKDMGGDTLRGIVTKLEEGELTEMKAVFARQAGEQYPLTVQLPYHQRDVCAMAGEQDGSFLI